MAGDDIPRPAPVVLRIKLRYDDVGAMVQRFAVNVGKSGLFLPTKSLQPAGAEVKFELRLADDTPVIVGLGRVKSSREPDPQAPRAAFGMAIELMRVTRESREIILKMLERRRALGLPDIALPQAADVDAARRASAAQELESGPVAVVAPVVAPAPAHTPLMTAPRRPSGSMAAVKVATVEPLAPEAPRRRRVPVGELIERASEPVARAPELDDAHVDVGAVLARARMLAGGSVDAELDAILDSAAAPTEISVEAASAELANQLGGRAIRRDRSARWAPPPPVEMSGRIEVAEQLSGPVAMPAAGDIAARVRGPAQVEARSSAEAAPVEPAAAVASDEARESSAPTPMPNVAEPAEAREPSAPAPMPDAVEAAPVEAAPVEASAPSVFETQPVLLVPPEPTFEEPEPAEPQTRVAAVFPTAPVLEPDDDAPAAFDEVGTAAHHAPPSGVLIDDDQDPAELEERIAAAPLEVELDDADLEEVEHTQLGDFPSAPPPRAEEEVDDFEILAEADADDADLLYAAPLPLPPAEAAARADAFAEETGYADGGAPYVDPDEQDAASAEPVPDPDPRRSREFDYEGRLDLGDDSDIYTLAGDLRSPPGPATFDGDSSRFRPPGMFDESDVIDTRALEARIAPAAQPEDFDLESALEQLDVDLDDLSIPHAAPQPSGARHPRAATVGRVYPPADDGILIDFDEDDEER